MRLILERPELLACAVALGLIVTLMLLGVALVELGCWVGRKAVGR